MIRSGITLLLLCGVVKAEVCEQCVLDQIDLPGNDMSGNPVKLADLEACVSLCLTKEGCVAVSFVTWHADEWIKGCHLKDAVAMQELFETKNMKIASVEMQCVHLCLQLQPGEKQGVGTMT